MELVKYSIYNTCFYLLLKSKSLDNLGRIKDKIKYFLLSWFACNCTICNYRTILLHSWKFVFIFSLLVCVLWMNFEVPFIVRFFFVLGYWYWVLKQNQEMYVGQRKISWRFWKLETIKSFLIKFEYANGNMKSTSLLVNLFQLVDFIDR